MPTLVSTGQITITDVHDGLHARLSNESFTIATDQNGNLGDYSGCVTTMSVYVGITDDTSNWSFSASESSGVIGSLVGSTYSVTDMTVDAGYVDITATRVGYTDLVSRFSVSKTRKGDAGPAITLISSGSGFSFVDGIPEPADQVISFTVARQSVSDPVEFYTTDGIALPTDNGNLSLSNYSTGTFGAGVGETAYLDLATFGNSQQVTVVAVAGNQTASQTIVRLDSSTAEAGATRNVFRGDWLVGTDYVVGDSVISGGYGWSCVQAHTASALTTTPTYPVTENAYWKLAAVKGEDAKLAYLTASSYVFKIAADGSVTPSSIAIAAVGQALAGSPEFSVTSGTATLTGSGTSRTLTANNLTTDQATIKVFWDNREDYVTITKVREGSSGLTVVMSNESGVLPSDSSGAVTNYTGSGTTFQVYEGSTALSASESATVSAFRIGTITQSPAASITVGAISYAGSTATIANHSAMSNGIDAVTLTIPITIYRANGSSTVVTKTQTIAKSKQGITGASGANAKLAVLSSTSTVFQVSKSGTATPSSVTLTAYGQNVAGNPTFTVTSGSVTLTGTGTSRNLAYTDLTTDSATIKIDWDGQTDYMTIVKVREGADGTIGADGKSAITVVVSNEAHTLPSSTGGVVSSYASSGTTIEVYEGTTKLTAGGSSNGSFTIGAPTQTPASTITVGAIFYASTTATVAAHSGMSNSTDSVAITYPVVVKRADGSTSTLNQVQTITKSKAGANGAAGQNSVTAILSNEAHTLPAATDGTVSSYAGSGTTIYAYDGATLLNYDGVGTSAGTWKVTTVATNITVGTLTYSDAYLTVGDHSGVAAGTDTAKIIYTISGVTAAGVAFSINKQQSFTKSKTGSTGAQGPSVSVTASRATSFTATDGNLDGGQTDIVFTANVSGVTSPTYVWSFSGFQTAPVNSGASTQTITAAQFGNAKSATVTCTVSGTYTDKVTIVRLEKSSATAGATAGSNLVKKATFSDGQSGGWYPFRYVCSSCHDGVGEIGIEYRDATESDNTFVVTPGEYIYIGCDVYSAGSSYGGNVGIAVMDSTGTLIAWLGAQYDPGKNWHRISATIQIPSNGVKAVPWLKIDAPANTVLPYVSFSRIYIGRQQEGATVGANSTNLQAGVSGNMFPNSDLSGGIENWALGEDQGGNASGIHNSSGVIWDLAAPDWCPAGGHTVGVLRPGTTDSASGFFDFGYKKPITVIPGKRYEASAYVAGHRNPVALVVGFCKYVNNVTTYITEIQYWDYTATGGQNLANWARVGGFFNVPSDCTFVRIWVRCGACTAANPYAWATRFFFGEAGVSQTTLSAWSDGGKSGTLGEVSQITSSNASTYIANAAIGSAQIGSLALVGNFSVKSGYTGQRVEMDANGGRVYDANNVLRVRWGIW